MPRRRPRPRWPWHRALPACSRSRASRSPATTRWATATRAQCSRPFLRADATIETLQKATAALETALRDKGFGLHRVALPPQEVGDTVTLTIVKFTVAKVRSKARSIYDEGNVRRTLPELREGESPNFKPLAIQTAIANENPNKQIQVGLREAEEPDKIDATITVKEQPPWTFAVGLSNCRLRVVRARPR